MTHEPAPVELAAFIRARLAEDAEIAEDARRRWLKASVYDKARWPNARERHIASHDPARVLRGVAAKRRIVDEVLSQSWCGDDPMFIPRDWVNILRMLAAEWSDHSYYEEDWTL